MVVKYLSDSESYPWEQFAQDYFELLEDRFQADRVPFDELAQKASEADVSLGCSCPTRKNPDVSHCHTVLALRFMKERYPELEVVFPERRDVEPS